MSIIIKRNTSWLSMGAALTVKLNREKITKIGHDQSWYSQKKCIAEGRSVRS